jgi:hypothetical protein
MFRTIFLTTLLVSAVAGCATPINVTADYQQGTDFRGYQTFGFLPERTLMVQSAEPFSPQLESRLKAAASAALIGKGFRQTENPGEADFLLAFNLGAQDQLRVNNFPNADQGGMRQTGTGPGTSEVRAFTEATLSIDILEAKSRQPVWFGRAIRTISIADRGDSRLVNQVVTAILEQFPPG